MKLLLSILFMACPMLPQAPQESAKPADNRLHLLATCQVLKFGAKLTAISIARGAAYPSVIELKGSVEIKGNGIHMLADEATYNEATCEIEASGKVLVKPYQAEPVTVPPVIP